MCERDFDNGTQMKSLSKKELKDWLEHYTLGQLWRNGEIGGGRWHRSGICGRGQL